MQSAPNDIKRLYRAAGITATPVVGVVLAAGLGRVALDVVAAARAGIPLVPAEVLTGGLAGLGAVGVLWLVLGVVLEALARVPGVLGRAAARASAALSPRVVRRVAALVLGAGLGSGAVGAAQAAPTAVVVQARGPALPDPSWSPGTVSGGPTAPTSRTTTTDTPDPGWTPEPPRVRPQPDVTVLTGTPRDRTRPSEVVVRRGDSLWSITARQLGEGASDAEVAAEWPRWYAANRDTVGPDPDVLHPGQVLRSPDAPTRAAS